MPQVPGTVSSRTEWGPPPEHGPGAPPGSPPEGGARARTRLTTAALVRALAPRLAEKHITIDAICPVLVDTLLIDDGGEPLEQSGFPIIDPSEVADAVLGCLADEGSGRVMTYGIVSRLARRRRSRHRCASGCRARLNRCMELRPSPPRRYTWPRAHSRRDRRTTGHPERYRPAQCGWWRRTVPPNSGEG